MKSGTTPGGCPKRSRWVFFCLLIAATLLAYQPAWHGGFIWDDDTHISANETLRSLSGLRDIWFQPGATCQYYPLTFTVFWADYHLWGLNPLGYHLQNLLLHCLVALLLWQVLQRLVVRAAWLAGAIFALHPVNVMSVAWMTELKNTLAGALVLGAVWAYLRFAGLGVYDTTMPERTNWRYGLLALAFFQLAMFAKTAVSFLPVTLLLLVWWKRGRIAWRWMWPVAAMLGIALGMGLLTLHVEHLHGATGDDFRMGVLERVLVSGRSFWFYLGKLFFPYPLIFIYERWQIDPGVWWQYVYPVATLGLLGGLWCLRKRLGKGPLVALAHFYVATSLLVLIQVLYMMLFTFVSDHWQYFGCMSVVALAAAGMDLALDVVAPGRRRLKWAGYGLLLLTLGVLTWRQCTMYADIETLWRTILARNPNCFLAQSNLGASLARQGKITEAIRYYDRALQLKSNSAEVHCNLGNALITCGDLAEAIQHYDRALQLDPNYYAARLNLGVALTRQGKSEEAIQQLDRALQINPDDAETCFYLGVALTAQGKLDQALQCYKQALRINPNHADALNNLGGVLIASGKYDDAAACFERALKLKPDSAETHHNLGEILARRGQWEAAIQHQKRAVEIKPDYVDALNSLGVGLAKQMKLDQAGQYFERVLQLDPNRTEPYVYLGVMQSAQGKPGEAMQNFHRALQLKPDYPEACYYLGITLADQGKSAEARQYFQQALNLATAQDNPALASAIRARLQAYQSAPPPR